MQIHTYLKTTFIDIKHNIGRFLAVVAIIFLGVGLFVGIKSISPNLNMAVNQYINKYNISDIQLISTVGLTARDKSIINSTPNIEAELADIQSFHDVKHNKNLQLYSYNPHSHQNLLTLVRGAYPHTAQEILVDEKLSTTYPLNSSIAIKNTQLRHQNYRVVGYIRSPLYIDQRDRGKSNFNGNQLAGYVYVPHQNFIGKIHSIIYIRFNDLTHQDQTTTNYRHMVNQRIKHLQHILNQLQLQHQQQLRNDLEVKKTQLTLLQQQVKLYPQLQPQLTKAKQQLLQAQQYLKQLSKTNNYYIIERKANVGFNSFLSLATRIDIIGNIFPVFFFFIGCLITFTTITRMIEENRQEIGTLKALGYRNYEIAQKYILYSLLIVAIATILGIIIGTKCLPPIVYQMLETTYTITKYPCNFWLTPILLAIGAALIATLIATIYILIIDLRQKPVNLLHSKTQKLGQHILLERLGTFWHWLNLAQKITLRNLFRYKIRMLLTILGVAGCTGLMVAGFGLQSSIEQVVPTQFKQINHYQAITSITPASSNQSAQKILRKDHHIKSFLPITIQAAKLQQDELTIYIPNSIQRFNKYVTLASTNSHFQQTVPRQGVLITEGIARFHKIKVGQNISLTLSNNQKVKLHVAGIVKNYLGNNIFVRPQYWQQQTKNYPRFNSFLLKTFALSSTQQNSLIKKLYNSGHFLTTTFMKKQMQQQTAVNTNLKPVVIIFVVLSGILAFVVLFNLTNINISERERELSTLKVLGFYNHEVTMTIVIENLIFTILGIIIGLFLGNILTRFIVTMASASEIVFPVIVPLFGYLFAIIMTMIFFIIVLGFTHYKLKTINMIKALKTIE